MRKHHVPYYVALFFGAVLAVALATITGQWLDLHRPIGREGLLTFLAVTVVIVLGVEALAGAVGDWIDDRIHKPRRMTS